MPTPKESMESQALPVSLGNLEFRNTRESGWDDLWALKSKLIAIRGPDGDGARDIVKNKTTAFLEAPEKEATRPKVAK
ncbi:hypothetical protein HOY80DRAFT_1095161 [Tuber brumale]|nr:hypothetical protein HOY80DRAFT_1095161 [Tuber brumale]